MTLSLKTCKTCGKELSLKWFYVYKNRGNTCIQGSCKACACAVSKKNYEKRKACTLEKLV